MQIILLFPQMVTLHSDLMAVTCTTRQHVTWSFGICWHTIMRWPAGGAEELGNYAKCRRLVDHSGRQLFGRSVCGWKIKSCVILINTPVQTLELSCLCFCAINTYSSTDSMPKKFPEFYGTRKFVTLLTAALQLAVHVGQQYVVTHTIRQTGLSA